MLKHSTISVTSTPQLIATGGSVVDFKTILIRDVTATCYVGGPSVDATDGFPIKANEVFSLELSAQDDVYIMTATTATCKVLVTRGG